MITHEIEVICKETSDFGRVSGITDSAGFSVILADVGFRRGISHVDSCFGITLVLQHADVGAEIFGSVHVSFYEEEMRGVA